MAHWSAPAMYLVAMLGVPNAIGAQSLTLAEIIAKTGPVNEDVLLRAMRLLCVNPELFVESSRGGLCEFSLTALGALLQTGIASQPSMLSGVLHWIDPGLVTAWFATPFYAIESPKCQLFEFAHGLSFFEYMKKFPISGKAFNETLTFFSLPENPIVTDVYDWRPFGGKTVVDVGGSLGGVMAALKVKYPDIKTVSFDLPEVINSISSPPCGVELVAGDMFDCRTIPRADGAIFMKHILHDWDDKQCIAILKSCKTALLPGAKIIIADAVLEEVGSTSELKKQQMTINWGVFVAGGRERDASQWQALAAAADLRVQDVKMTPIPNCQFVTLCPP